MEPRLTTDRQPAQLLTMLIGVTFILVGLLGFVPGIAGVLPHGRDRAPLPDRRRGRLLGFGSTAW